MGARLLNRELSWLQFNERVIGQVAASNVPLLERLKFIAISSSNLDEFFQVRVATLNSQIDAEVTRPSPDGLTPSATLAAVKAKVSEFVVAQEAALAGVLSDLIVEGIEIVGVEELDEAGLAFIGDYFEDHIFPVLTPLAFDSGHPFPYISNLALNLGVHVVDPDDGTRCFARVKVPPKMARFVRLPGSSRFVSIESIIARFVGRLFNGMQVVACHEFRVTRSADLELEDDVDDILTAMEIELRRRRFGRATRLEVRVGFPSEMLETLVEELDLDESDVTVHVAPLDLTALFSLYASAPSTARDQPWESPPPIAFRDPSRSMFSVLRERDVFLHHPYESFTASVEAFIAAAASDPHVQSIKMTLYRTSGDSPIAQSLIRAAERGVQVAVLIELKARFDEAANINWARELESAGVHVVYGLVGLKTHTKAVLVTRQELSGLRRYVHLGTGNYNSKTSRVYEDVGLMTSDPVIGAEVASLFNHLTGFSRQEVYQTLTVAPDHLRPRLLQLIAKESSFGPAGCITAKMNGLSDPEIIEGLYAASAAGVRVELIVRGICCLRAGVPGVSDNITVRSVLGRFLEHSRIYRFAHGRDDNTALHLIGSADLMHRNLDRRVETLVTISTPAHRERIDVVLGAVLEPSAIRWELGPDDRWARLDGDGTLDVQHRIHALYADAERHHQAKEGVDA